MHFLIANTPMGEKLLDFGDEIMRLKSQMMDYMSANRGQHSVILNESMARDTYLCDDFGIPIQDEGYLVRLDDL